MSKETTPQKIFIREDGDSWRTEMSVARYADEINKKCLPVIKELGLDSEDIKRTIRYCCKGGRKRMFSDFMADIPENGSFRKIAKLQFENVMSSHPEYEECANTWKYANLLMIGNDGLIHKDVEAIGERGKTYISSPEGLAFMQKLSTLIKALNDIFEGTFCFKTSTFHEIVYFDDKSNRWAMNPRYLSEGYIKRISSNEYRIRPQDYNEKEHNEYLQKLDAADERRMRDFGLEGEELQEAAEANTD